MIGEITLNNEIVKYGNRLNLVKFAGLKPVEMNIFFSIVSRVYERGAEPVVLTYQDIRNLSNDNHKGTRFIKNISKMADNLRKAGAVTRNNQYIHYYNFFSDLLIDDSNKTVTVQVNEKALPLFNDLKHWTRFSLQEFTNLRSGYSKTLYRLLKQYRTTGVLNMGIDDFREIMCIPKSYSTSNIQNRVLNTVKQELSPLFRNFKIQKKHSNTHGAPIVGYKFTFTPERKDAEDVKVTNWSRSRKKIDYIRHNDNLSLKERKAALLRLNPNDLMTVDRKVYDEALGEIDATLQEDEFTKEIERTTVKKDEFDYDVLNKKLQDLNKKGEDLTEDEQLEKASLIIELRKIELGYSK